MSEVIPLGFARRATDRVCQNQRPGEAGSVVMKENQPVHHPSVEDARSSEAHKEYPIGRSILGRLKKTVNEEWDSWLVEEGEDTFKTLYLTERRVCIPEHLLSGEIMEDIMSLFYYPLSAVREELKERTGTKEFIWIFVQPSYTDTSFAVMVTGEKILLPVSDKAWNFFWESQQEMVKELEGWYQIAETRIKGGARLFADDAWALRTLLRQVREEDIPQLKEENRCRADELRRAADLLSRLLEEPQDREESPGPQVKESRGQRTPQAPRNLFPWEVERPRATYTIYIYEGA